MSDSKFRIKNIGADSIPMRLIKMSNDTQLTTGVLGSGETNAYIDTPEDIQVCLAAPKQSTVIAQKAQDELLAELIVGGKISEPFIDAEEVTISHNANNTETDLAIRFSSRIKDNILSNVVRKQHYLLNLGVSDVSLNDIVIRVTKRNAANNDLIGTSNQILNKTKLLRTAGGDIIYPLEISESDINYYIDLIVDFDGDRTLYSPAFHRVKISVTVDANAEASAVVVRGFDAALVAEMVGSGVVYSKEANSFSILDTTTSIKTLISKESTALFQYKLDDSIILKQSFVLEFLANLVDEATVVTLTTSGVTINKAELIAKAQLVNGKYYYLLTIENHARKNTVVDVTIDYDGTYKDFVTTNYRFTFISNVTTPPPIPMFAMGAMRARIEIKDENTYYYEGYRFLQFKIPITGPSLIKLDIEATASNYTIKPVNSSKSIMPIETKEELKEFAAFTTDDITTYEEGKQVFWGFRELGDAIFQIRLPVGITGTVYFGLSAIDNNTNLLTYNKDTMQITGINDSMPALSINGSTLFLVHSATVASSNGLYPGTAIYDTLLRPGMAIALSGFSGNGDWVIRLLDEVTKHIEITNISNGYIGGIRNQATKADTIAFNSANMDIGSKTPANRRVISLNNLLGRNFSAGTFVIYRTIDNKLMLLQYDLLGSVVISLINKWTLIEDLNVNGYPLDKGMKLVYTQNNSPSSTIVEMTEPYSVTLEELTTFDPEQTFVADASIKLVEIYGRNSLPTN